MRSRLGLLTKGTLENLIRRIKDIGMAWIQNTSIKGKFEFIHALQIG